MVVIVLVQLLYCFDLSILAEDALKKGIFGLAVLRLLFGLGLSVTTFNSLLAVEARIDRVDAMRMLIFGRCSKRVLIESCIGATQNVLFTTKSHWFYTVHLPHSNIMSSLSYKFKSKEVVYIMEPFAEPPRPIK